MLHKFIVKGVDKSSGMDTEIVVYAESQKNAQVKAELRDLIVTSCKLSNEVVRTDPTPHRETSSGDQPDTYCRPPSTSSSVMMHPALPPTIVAIVAVTFLISQLVKFALEDQAGLDLIAGLTVIALIILSHGYLIRIASTVVIKVAAPFKVVFTIALVSTLWLVSGNQLLTGYWADRLPPFEGLVLFLTSIGSWVFFFQSILAANWIKYPGAGPIGVKKGMLISLIATLMLVILVLCCGIMVLWGTGARFFTA